MDDFSVPFLRLHGTPEQTQRLAASATGLSVHHRDLAAHASAMRVTVTERCMTPRWMHGEYHLCVRASARFRQIAICNRVLATRLTLREGCADYRRVRSVKPVTQGFDKFFANV